MDANSIFDTKAVNILCSCNRYLPLYRTYFCRYCYKIRCYNCITHEVDCFYCPTCLENMASGEANSRRDKCANCFDCPGCGNMLSVRASIIQLPKIDDQTKMELQKLYYMACSFCRWTTRDSGIPDKKTSSNAWPMPENPHENKIKELISKFNEYASREKMEKERTKYASRKNYFFLLDSGHASNRRRYSTQIRQNRRQSDVDRKPIEILHDISVDCVKEIDESVFEQKLVLEEVTDIEQRLRDPERQPDLVQDMYPISKQILVKRSMRCRECDHNLCKPEIATNSIRFKINLGSLYHVPELKIRPLAPGFLQYNKTSKIVLTISNPAHKITKIKFARITQYTDEISTAKLDMPSTELQLAAKNEFLAISDVDTNVVEFKDDDPKIIADRKVHKLEFYAHLTPMKSSGPVLACVLLNFEYKDTLSHLTGGIPTDVSWPSVVYKLNFGLLGGDSA